MISVPRNNPSNFVGCLSCFSKFISIKLKQRENDALYYLHRSNICTVFCHRTAFLSNCNEIHFLGLHISTYFKAIFFQAINDIILLIPWAMPRNPEKDLYVKVLSHMWGNWQIVLENCVLNTCFYKLPKLKVGKVFFL